jgi:CHAD domain-containing protein
MLEQDYGLRVNFARMSPLRQKLSEQREHVAQDQSDLQTRIEDIVVALDDSTADIANWQLENATAGDLARGMQRVYRRARKGWKRAQQTHDPDLLHDWRKRNKYLRYHFQLLKGLDKDWASSCHKGFKELSNLLGDHHDLEVLRGVLDEMDQNVLDPVAESEFRILLREKQDALYREALQWGDALLKRKPKQMRKRVSKLLDLVEKT